MDEANYLHTVEEVDYEAYMSLALSSGDEEVQRALEEASANEE